MNFEISARRLSSTLIACYIDAFCYKNAFFFEVGVNFLSVYYLFINKVIL